MSNLSTLPKGDSAWLLRKAIERIMEQVSVLETNIGSSTTGNSANTQIIFNDNGTLRGDAGLVYNKTTDALTVAGLVTAGSATITGDLTVDTSTLKVDSTNNRVGIGTASPTSGIKLDIVSTTSDNFVRFSDSVNATGYLGVRAANGAVYLHGNNNLVSLSCSTSNTTATEQLRITNPGVFEFLDGVSGTRMTLNSTGLGIGVTPANNKLQVLGNIGLPNVCMASGETNGEFSIDVANLFAQTGAVWRQCSLLLVYSGVDQNLGNSTVLQTIVTLQGLATWNTISKNDVVGVASVAVSLDTTTSARITVTVPAGNFGSAYVMLLGGVGPTTRPSVTINI